MKVLKILLSILFFISISSLTFGQVDTSKTKKYTNKYHDHEAMTKIKVDKKIIRTGEIDLEKIDLNEDGFVYQCFKHWNVLSDKSEHCPISRIKLQKVAIKKAKENLIKHKFKIKN